MMNESTSANKIRYFRDCYKADTRTFVLSNYFSVKVSHRLVFSGEDEFLSGHLNQFPVPESYAEKVNSDLLLYQKEKELFAFSIFIIGAEEGISDAKHKICAPLFIHPVMMIEEGGLHYFIPDFEKTFINLNFISKLVNEKEDKFFEELNKAFIPGKVSFAIMGELKRILEKYIPDFVADELLNFPALYDEPSLKKFLNVNYLKKQGGFIAIPAAGLGIIKKSDQTRGVLNELASLAGAETSHSSVLKALFDNQWEKRKDVIDSKNSGRLNEAQRAILKSAKEHVITQVTGPPGTGKSFAIASLAIDFLSVGKSVLISAKTNEAVNVIADKIKYDFDLESVLIRAGKSDYKKKLKSYLKDELSKAWKSKQNSVSKFQVKSSEKGLDKTIDNVEGLVKYIANQLDNEYSWSEFLAEKGHDDNWYGSLKKKYIKWRHGLKVPYWKKVAELFDALNILERNYQEYLKLAHEKTKFQSLKDHRLKYSMFSSALSARYGSKRETLFDQIDFKEILKTFPIWLVKASEISGVLPLKKELFDLLIIDEATQCDISSVLPLMQRAKGAVIVGDPKQLNHISFLSRAFQNELIRKHRLNDIHFESSYNFRDLSILDLINNKLPDQDQIVFLDEHYRSNPDIIAFSNQEFYNNSLTIMTDHPERQEIVSTHFIQTGGIRNSKGVNEVEAGLLVSKVKLLISKSEKLNEPAVKTIGILSPFRDQIDYLNDLILKNIGSGLIKKYRILCGTAYSFQGEERDVMFLSMCVDIKSHSAAYYHLNKPDVFNVSVTRAKHKQYVFLSVSANDLKDSVFRNFLTFDWRKQSIYSELELKEEFATSVAESLANLKIETKAAYPVAGRKVDFLCKLNNQYFGINLIGYPGEFKDGQSVEELQLLYRSGLKVFPLPYTYWYFDRDTCLQEIKLFADNLS